MFGAMAATIVSDNGTSLVATSPAAAGTVDITVTTAGGTSPTSTNDQFVFVAAPTVITVSPTAGPTTGGTTVTITGTNLGTAGAATVMFGETAATIVSDNGTSLVATSPAGPAGTADITVTTAGGTSPTSTNDQFTFQAAPTVTTVSPTAGPTAGGSTVTITGTNLGTAATASVMFGATAATIVNDNGTSLVATSPAGAAGTVDITVTTAGGTSTTSANDQFTYMAAPTVTNVSPTAGPTAGGTSVTITGTNLGTAATATVTFGATAATVISDNGTTLVAASPAGAAGTVDITVTTAGGTSITSANDQFTYMVAPTVTNVKSNGRSDKWRKHGDNYRHEPGYRCNRHGQVRRDSGIHRQRQRRDSCGHQPGRRGGKRGRDRDDGGRNVGDVGNDQFTYLAAPAVTSISPTAGPTAGGTSVTITGTNLGTAAAVTVKFGATAAIIVSDNGTSLVASSPAGAAGTVDISVTTAGGTSPTLANDQFTYLAAPVVATVSPRSGPTAGASTVTITGANLGTAATVTVMFGATAATVVSNNGSTLVATSPAGVAGAVDITVTTAGGTSATSANDRFTYVALPIVTTVNPAAGPTAGGSTVTIKGMNLGTVATATVTFGSTSAAIVSDDGTTLVATNPAGATGTVDITVTTAGGTSTASANDQFTYVAAPTLTTVSPMAGPTTGGTPVTITGTNLGTALTATVTFGVTSGTIVSNNGTTLVVISPAGAVGTVDITVTTAGGTSPTLVNDHFTYVAAPTMATVSPTAGPMAGGTPVTITGTNLGHRRHRHGQFRCDGGNHRQRQRYDTCGHQPGRRRGDGRHHRDDGGRNFGDLGE